MKRSCSQPPVNNSSTVSITETMTEKQLEARDKVAQYLPCTFVYPYTSNLASTSLSLPSLTTESNGLPANSNMGSKNAFQHQSALNANFGSAAAPSGNLPMRKLSRLSNLCWVSSVSQPDLQTAGAITTVTTAMSSPATSLPTSRASSPVPPSISARGSVAMSPAISSMGSNNSVYNTTMSNGSLNGAGSARLPRMSSRVTSPQLQKSPYGSSGFSSPVQLDSPYSSGTNLTSCGRGPDPQQLPPKPMYHQIEPSGTHQQPTVYQQNVNQIGFAQNLVYLTEDGSLIPVLNYSDPNNFFQPINMQLQNNQQQTMFVNPPGAQPSRVNSTSSPTEVHASPKRRSSLLYRIQRRSNSPKPPGDQLKPCAVIPPNSVLDSGQPDGKNLLHLDNNNYGLSQQEIPSIKAGLSDGYYPQQSNNNNNNGLYQQQPTTVAIKADVATSCEDLNDPPMTPPHSTTSSSTATTTTTQQPYPFVVETCQICNVFAPSNNIDGTDMGHNHHATDNNIPYFSYTPCMYGNQLVLLNNRPDNLSNQMNIGVSSSAPENPQYGHQPPPQQQLQQQYIPLSPVNIPQLRGGGGVVQPLAGCGNNNYTAPGKVIERTSKVKRYLINPILVLLSYMYGPQKRADFLCLFQKREK